MYEFESAPEDAWGVGEAPTAAAPEVQAALPHGPLQWDIGAATRASLRMSQNASAMDIE